jgi:hypothetical protein
MTTSSAPKERRWSRGSIGFVLVGGALIILAFRKVLPWTGVGDTPEIGTRELADLSLESTQYLQSLTTAVVGGALLLLGQKEGFQAEARLNLRPLMVGFLSLALSLITGFVTSEAALEAAVQGLVHAKVETLFWLRILQLAFLLVGVLLIGWSLFWERLRKTG